MCSERLKNQFWLKKLRYQFYVHLTEGLKYRRVHRVDQVGQTHCLIRSNIASTEGWHTYQRLRSTESKMWNKNLDFGKVVLWKERSKKWIYKKMKATRGSERTLPGWHCGLPTYPGGMVHLQKTRAPVTPRAATARPLDTPAVYTYKTVLVIYVRSVRASRA